MFAYCGNNPILCIDLSGNYPVWQELFGDGDYGFIHRAVQLHIIKNYPGVQKEGYIYNKKGEYCGRADLYMDDGSIWEVKTTTTGIIAAERQLKKYSGKKQTLKNGATTHIGTGGFSGNFSLVCGEDSYTVEYHTPKPGVVLYFTQKSKQQELAPYAVYVPIRERTPSNQPYIGNEYAYAAAAGIAVIGIAALCGGGNGFCLNKFAVFGY